MTPDTKHLPTPIPHPPARGWFYLALVLMVLGAVARIWGAWHFRLNTNPDCGVVALMARHMAEGKDWPVFFYGQAYMGALEPAVSGLLCKVFGVSGFMVCLGTALLGILTLPVIYLWARDAGGPAAGAAALAATVLGPRVYYLYQFSPRGGYTATLLIGALLLWLTSRLISRERAGEAVPWRWFMALGFLAGLGWYVNQLIAYALLTAALLFVAFLRSRAFTLRLVPGVLGFLLGSLPLWIWNLRNDWQTFNFLNAPGAPSVMEGMRLFFTRRLVDFMGLSEAAPAAAGLLLLTYALLVFAAGWALAVLPRGVNNRRVVPLTMALAFLGVSVGVFASTHFSLFNTARYLVPLFPALAVTVGVGAVQLGRGRVPWLGALPLLLLIVAQTPVLPELLRMQEGFAERHRRAGDLAVKLREHDLKTIYAHFNAHWMNFALKEEFAFTDLTRERYQPYSEQGEQDSRPGILDNYGKFRDFLAATGGGAELIVSDQHRTYHAFTPPADGRTEIPPALWDAVVDAGGNDVLDGLADRSTSTYWGSAVGPQEDEWLDITFKEPVEVSGVRMLSNNAYGYPPVWRAYGKSADDEDWEPLTPHLRYSTYFWSGPRPYWGGSGFRVEFRIPRRRLVGLRIARTENRRNWDWRLAELQVFGPGLETVPEEKALPSLLALLGARGIDRLYADRWVANRVLERSQGSIAAPLEAGIHAHPKWTANDNVQFTPLTAALVRAEDAGSAREVLGIRNIAMRETEVGPWVLFDFEPGGWLDAYAADPALVWRGFGFLTGGAKDAAAELVREATHLAGEGRTAQAAERALKAIALYPNYLTAMKALPDWLREAGDEALADELASQRSRLCEPEIPINARFKNGIVLLGMTVEQPVVAAGERLALRYYWRCPPGTDTDGLAVFFHIEQAERPLQDDHVFLSHLEASDVSFQPFEEVFMVRRILGVPESAPTGTYDMAIGVYHRHTGVRLKPQTKLKVIDDAVHFPSLVEVSLPSRTKNQKP